MSEARFWVLHVGSPVRLKLRAGQTVSAWNGGPNEEGYAEHGVRWAFDGETVRRTWYTDGRDCDGRVTSEGEDHCRIDALESHDSGWAEDTREGRRWPVWKEDAYDQQDYSAEAAGY